MFTGFLRSLGVLPSVKESVRAQQFKLKSEGRTLEVERVQLARDIASLEQKIRRALDSGDEAVALSLSKTRQRLVRIDAAKASKMADLTMLHYEVASLASIETDHRMMTGVGQIAQQQSSQLKVGKIVKQQRETTKALQQLRDSQAVVREAMDEMVAGDETDVASVNEDADAQRYIDQLQVIKAEKEMSDKMPPVPTSVPGRAKHTASPQSSVASCSSSSSSTSTSRYNQT